MSERQRVKGSLPALKAHMRNVTSVFCRFQRPASLLRSSRSFQPQRPRILIYIREEKYSLLNISWKSGSNYSSITTKVFPCKSWDYIPQHTITYLLLFFKLRVTKWACFHIEWLMGRDVMLQCCLYSVHAVESVWIMKITWKQNKN